MTVDTKELVTTIAYLIGVKKHIVEQCFDVECHDTLQKLYAHKARPSSVTFASSAPRCSRSSRKLTPKCGIIS